MHTIETSRSSSCWRCRVALIVLAAVILALVVLFATVASAGEHDAATVLVPDGGKVVQQGQRVDIYDARSKRIGYGTIHPDGSMDVFNMDGTRRATIQTAPSGGVRATAPGKC